MFLTLALTSYRAVSALRKGVTVQTDAPSQRLPRAMQLHLSLVWRVLRRAGLRPDDADEAAQDVFLVLARRLADVPVAAERSFLVQTALRVASDRRRSLRRHAHEPLTEEPLAVQLPTDELVRLRRARALLDEALDALNPEQREVFVLVELEELTGSEAGSVLGIPAGTVASRLRSARQTFDQTVKRLHARESRLP